ncbi:hypothetical protein TNCV_4321081 [Trichonephila clavipes]|uniref:Uncharacterized protein n=1 Tax=Trichonephila clavipes TaxID=2585209 RepID=A0A8X6VJD5_TRICX|nr:hypothetical protein TNCV_4321081 [Trichonephila clavipes]
MIAGAEGAYSQCLNYYGHLALAAKVAEIPVYALIPGKEVRNLVLGVTRDASTMCFVCSRSGDGSAS